MKTSPKSHHGISSKHGSKFEVKKMQTREFYTFFMRNNKNTTNKISRFPKCLNFRKSFEQNYLMIKKVCFNLRAKAVLYRKSSNKIKSH